MPNSKLEFYENAPVPDEEIVELIEEEIRDAPRAPSELIGRLRDHHSSSPADSGGDIDAMWEEVNTSGSEAFGGHNPTPDQSDAEANAHAMGIDFQDNEPLDILKVEKRDRHRFEMDEKSKNGSNTI